MAYHLTVLEPGKKRVKLYAGKGRLTGNLIHAIQFKESEKPKLDEWISELHRDNPGYKFSLRKVPANQNFVDGKQ